MAQALGVQLLDDEGRDIRPGGAALLDLATIDIGGLDPAARRARFLVACDVDNPLVGSQGASAVYGPQKGATPGDVLLLDRALTRFADVIPKVEPLLSDDYHQIITEGGIFIDDEVRQRLEPSIRADTKRYAETYKSVTA